VGDDENGALIALDETTKGLVERVTRLEKGEHRIARLAHEQAVLEGGSVLGGELSGELHGIEVELGQIGRQSDSVLLDGGIDGGHVEFASALQLARLDEREHATDQSRFVGRGFRGLQLGLARVDLLGRRLGQFLAAFEFADFVLVVVMVHVGGLRRRKTTKCSVGALGGRERCSH
jgi:hypothetical protein